MSCKFSLKPKQDVNEIYELAMCELAKFDATYHGDTTGGNFIFNIFGMTFKGSVRVENSIIFVEMKDKPLLLPCSIIESSLKSYLSKL